MDSRKEKTTGKALKVIIIVLFAVMSLFSIADNANRIMKMMLPSESTVKLQRIEAEPEVIAEKPVKKELNKSQKKILKSVDKLAWPLDTPKEKWEYETGDFKSKECKKIYNELGYSSGRDYTACNHFIDAVMYDAFGYKIETLPPSSRDEYTDLSKHFKTVHKGEIKDFELEPGDIIRYRKNKTDGSRTQHSLIYYGDDCLAEAGVRIRYPVILSCYDDEGVAKWDTSVVDLDTIEVLRVKKDD